MLHANLIQVVWIYISKWIAPYWWKVAFTKRKNNNKTDLEIIIPSKIVSSSKDLQIDLIWRLVKIFIQNYIHIKFLSIASHILLCCYFFVGQSKNNSKTVQGREQDFVFKMTNLELLLTVTTGQCHLQVCSSSPPPPKRLWLVQRSPEL